MTAEEGLQGGSHKTCNSTKVLQSVKEKKILNPNDFLPFLCARSEETLLTYNPNIGKFNKDLKRRAELKSEDFHTKNTVHQKFPINQLSSPI